MNRPLLFVVLGGIVVIIATVLNFVLLHEDVPPQATGQHLAADGGAAVQAAEQARIDARKAAEAARKAADAIKEADRAKAEAEAARERLARSQTQDAADKAAVEAREAEAQAARIKADQAREEAEQSRLAAERAAQEAVAARQAARATEGEAPQSTAGQAAPAKAAEAAPADGAKATPEIPTFDIVRIERDGSAVIAGRAAPESEVVVRAGRDEIGRAKANRKGEWVVVPDQPLASGSQELGLSARTGDAELASPSAVVVVVPERVQPASASAAPKDALAVAVPRNGGGASRVLQAPRVEDMKVAVDAVDYDAAGNLTISGYAPAGGRLNLYLDNGFIGQTLADVQGRWSLRPQGVVAPGLYTLRVDLVDPAGTVLARVAFPFSRAAVVPDLKPGDFAVVQPGNSLWRIARRTYGAGIQYHEIYAANREQIQDPDLIYPGQIFALPKVE